MAKPGDMVQNSAPEVVVTLALPPTSPFAEMLSDEGESEVTATVTESDSWPTPSDEGSDTEKKGPAQLFPTAVSLRTPEPEPLPRSKPTWWSDAWEMLD
jgi:hypothetical protein